MPGLVIKPRSRIFHGHDWVYASEVKKAFGNPQPGDVVTLKDFKDRPLGSAIYNPASQIVARRISRRAQKLDSEFFARRIDRAAGLRRRLGFGPDRPQRPYRLLWSEADGVPGVVVDVYGPTVVVQTLTLAMDRHKPELVGALVDRLAPATVVERNDSPVRKAEGLPLVTGVLHGPEPGESEAGDGGIEFFVDPLDGQKTGLYLDQFDNYQAVAAHAPGRRVLDCFSNQGGFALHAAKAGATSVVAVDSSEAATAAAARNAAHNGLAIETVTANAFDFLKAAAAAAEPSYDLVVLDPPSFTKSKKTVGGAMRGYKEIHLRALQSLAPGGLLATFCCSHHVSAAEFWDVIGAASVDAKKTLRLVGKFGQRGDHPVIATVPETEYLKGFLLETVPAW